MTKRKFSLEFKKQVVEELIGGVSTLAQLSRRHEIAASLIQTWRKKYSAGEMTMGVSKTDPTLLARIGELEKMVGRLTMENDLLKKAKVYIEERRRKASLPITARTLAASKEDVKS